MTTSAWQKRDMERQRLLDTMRDQLLYKVQEIEAGVGVTETGVNEKSFFYALVRIVLLYLELDGNLFTGNIKRDKINEYFRIGSEDAVMFFHRRIVGPITNFGRSPEEKLALHAQFFSYILMPQIVQPFNQALSKQQMENPQLIYHAELATDEVPIEDEKGEYEITKKKSPSSEFYPEGLDNRE